MSDQNPGAVATEAPPAPAPHDDAASTGRSSKAMLIAGGVALLVLAVLAYVLFGMGSGSEEESGAVPPHTTAPAKPASGSKSGDTSKDSSKSSTKSTDVEGRNPFEPLTTVPVDTGTTTDTGTDTSTTPPAEEMVTVSLTKVSSNGVTAVVDSKTYKDVSEGETFATNFQVYAIFNDDCAGFLYGDDSFALCEGKTTQLTKL